MNLNQYIAHAGVCSRRKATELIKNGSVTINGTQTINPATQINEGDQVRVNGKLIRQEEKVYILLNKPRGVVTTVSDEKKRNTVLDVIGKEVKERVYPIGRLDINTTGLLLLTNDGELTQKLAHPKYKMEKIYQVTLHRSLHSDDHKRLMTGVQLKDGTVKLDTISEPFGVKKNQIKVTIHSGKYRVVRRLFEHLGYFVKKLDRVSFAGIPKGKLPIGAWRFLKKSEIKKLKK